MENLFVYIIGFLAQALFSARLLIQWIQSEKAGTSLSPLIFWQLSILASWLLFTYGLLRNDFAIVCGQIITYFIYIRNLQLEKQWKKLPAFTRMLAYATPVFALIYLARDWAFHYQQLFQNKDIPLYLLIWGTLGQIIFTSRFVYQWLYSENRKKSYLPMGFWIISLLGSLMILSYAIYRKDPVLMLGQGFGLVVYARNISLIKQSKVKLKYK